MPQILKTPNGIKAIFDDKHEAEVAEFIMRASNHPTKAEHNVHLEGVTAKQLRQFASGDIKKRGEGIDVILDTPHDLRGAEATLKAFHAAPKIEYVVQVDGMMTPEKFREEIERGAPELERFAQYTSTAFGQPVRPVIEYDAVRETNIPVFHLPGLNSEAPPLIEYLHQAGLTDPYALKGGYAVLVALATTGNKNKMEVIHELLEKPMERINRTAPDGQERQVG